MATKIRRSRRCALDRKQIGNRPIRTKTDAFAQHLADGLTVPEASKKLGIYAGDGNALLQRIRKSFGAQAR